MIDYSFVVSSLVANINSAMVFVVPVIGALCAVGVGIRIFKRIAGDEGSDSFNAGGYQFDNADDYLEFCESNNISVDDDGNDVFDLFECYDELGDQTNLSDSEIDELWENSEWADPEEVARIQREAL